MDGRTAEHTVAAATGSEAAGRLQVNTGQGNENVLSQAIPDVRCTSATSGGDDETMSKVLRGGILEGGGAKRVKHLC